MKLELIRTENSDTHTLGILREYVSDVEICRTIERPWLDNMKEISCIPADRTYTVVPDDTGKHQGFKILDVEGRTNIEIHSANWAVQLNGCIAVGDAVKDSADGRMVTNSKKTLDMLKSRYPEGFELFIRSV